jgi:hypothetical protein
MLIPKVQSAAIHPKFKLAAINVQCSKLHRISEMKKGAFIGLKGLGGIKKCEEVLRLQLRLIGQVGAVDGVLDNADPVFRPD